MSKYRLFFLIIIALCGLSASTSAQLNLKVGYTGGYSNLEVVNTIFAVYDNANPEATRSLSPIKFRNGIEVGARYKFFDQFAMDLGIISMTGKNKAEGIVNADGNVFSTTWKSSVLSYFIGLESYYEKFGLGANIGYQNLKYSNQTSITDNSINIMSERVLNSKFYLIIDLPSSSTAVSLRPYISTTWQPYDFSPVAEELTPTAAGNPSTYSEDMVIYGISILFLNGRQ